MNLFSNPGAPSHDLRMILPLWRPGAEALEAHFRATALAEWELAMRTVHASYKRTVFWRCPSKNIYSDLNLNVGCCEAGSRSL